MRQDIQQEISISQTSMVLGVRFNVSNIGSAVYYVRNHLEQMKGEYITFCNVHTTVMAHDNPDYRSVQNGAALTFADGMPIAKLQQKRGYIYAERVAGPDFMDAMFRDSMNGKITHYFYGASEDTLHSLETRLVRNYPGIVIRGMYSPPFRPLEDISEEEDAADTRRINESGADIVWVGLGAPKQENWMAMHRGRVNALMIGVGAGFDFYSGTIRRAPDWVQKIGMEWLYRLLQDPRRLLKRYAVTNCKFLWYLLTEDGLSGKGAD